MKKLLTLAFAAICACQLASCATPTPTLSPSPISLPSPSPSPEPKDGMIEPGDEIEGMVFAPIDEIDWDISLGFLCDFESADETESTATIACFTGPGGRVFFGNCNGILYDTEEEVAELWQDFQLEVTFDGQVIDLPAFGYLDTEAYVHDEAHLRMWNLAVENITPGTHTIQCRTDFQGESDTRTYLFTVSDAEAFPALTVDVPPRIHPHTSEAANLNYLLYVPDAYGVDPEREWPLLLYLHGMDRVNTSVIVLENDYPLNTLADQADFPFIVVAPQGTGEYEFWATDEMVGSIMALLDEIQAVLAVDTGRVYLTGASAGGNGTWSIGVRHPERFAAMAPMMGYYGWPPAVPENICDLAGTPVWAFHGDKDELIPLDAGQILVDALEACGGDVEFTVFPDVGHDVEGQRVYTPELYTWLLSHSLEDVD